MNVLIFVMTMLMLLSMMTYARLETYRNSQTFESLFENYMKKNERSFITLIAQKNYDRTHGSSKGASNEQQAENKVSSRPRISIAPLVSAGSKDKINSQEFKQAVILLKNLINTLYTGQHFFEEIKNKQPSFLDDLIAAMMQASAQLPDNKKLKTVEDLSNLSLGDPQLDEVFYKMLHGATYQAAGGKENQSILLQNSLTPPSAVESDDDPSDKNLIENESQEPKTSKDYFSLLDFITLDDAKKVRIYLAPKEVLKAIFGADEIVEEIIRERKLLYNQARSADKQEDKKKLSEHFKQSFDGKHLPDIESDTLDYSVTKTNPQKYEKHE